MLFCVSCSPWMSSSALNNLLPAMHTYFLFILCQVYLFVRDRSANRRILRIVGKHCGNQDRRLEIDQFAQTTLSQGLRRHRHLVRDDAFVVVNLFLYAKMFWCVFSSRSYRMIAYRITLCFILSSLMFALCKLFLFNRQTIFLLLSIFSVVTNAGLTVFTMTTLRDLHTATRYWIFVLFQWVCFSLQVSLCVNCECVFCVCFCVFACS